MATSIGFIGPGEVGYLFAKGLTGAGAAAVAAYNIDLEDAERRARFQARHVYVDLNSTSPMVKEEIGRMIAPTDARFVEAAVMAAVPR